MKRWVEVYLGRLALSPLVGGALVVLAVLNLVAAVWLVQAMFADAELNVGAAQRMPPAAPQRERSGSAPKPPVAYQATLNRPVFFKTRQPYAAPPPPLPPPPPQIVEVAPPAPPPPLAEPELKLAGVIITAGIKRAYLVPKENPSGGSWIGEGEEIQGWRVYAISDSSVALQSSGRTVRLPMYHND